ncbi:MAG: tRNA (adenosine(37)-N6)-threonylcarbamoyltransferase complex dimerization subunit type 1 TsaB [Bacteroidia bacterium]|jgi:tRNA threonylcarbamoyladenosine biosynthesis protein TsaB|nr:tRNA (adenosine(37)-N6)-threonylcarbamoyltransferase complex dimerization subunit type 1 TsaB [Bacteroidia bacterium]
MALLLCVETSTPVCSVALFNDTKFIGGIEIAEPNMHASMLAPIVKQVMHEANYSLTDVDAIAVSAGPGSYTGLRVGVATVKGICYALQKPLIAVSTLQSLASILVDQTGENKNILYAPMIDARRMEVYTALFDENNNVVIPPMAHVLDQHSFETHLHRYQIIAGGTGAEKSLSVIQHPNFKVLPNINCSAKGMINAAYKCWLNNQFESAAYFEPFYLKDFVGTVPKSKVVS